MLPPCGAEVGGPDGFPQSVEVTDDRLAVRIPLGPEDSDNYVVGVPMPINTTSVHLNTASRLSEAASKIDI